MELRYKQDETEEERQEKNKAIVERDIKENVGVLVSELMDKQVLTFEDIENPFKLDRETLISDIKSEHAGQDEKQELEEEIRALNPKGESLEDLKNVELLELAENLGYERETYNLNGEILEYWTVSKWLYEKLKELGEPTINKYNLYIWGRTTTGQAIFLDNTITEVRKLADRDLKKLEKEI